MSFSLGIIGLGRIAQAIALPLLEKGHFLPGNIFSIVGNKSSVEKVLNKFPKGMNIVAANDPTEYKVWDAPIQLIAVKPNQLNLIKEKFEKVKGLDFSQKPLLISVLAGVTLDRLELDFPNHTCVRAVPNTPSLVGEGLTGISWGNGVSDSQKQSVQRIFQPISEVFDLPESQINAFLALTSSGPAYVSLIIEALSDGAVAVGLPRSLANDLAIKTLSGTAALLKLKELHPAQLKDMVASPGGTTIAALRHLEKAGLRSALMEAVVAAAERSREMS